MVLSNAGKVSIKSVSAKMIWIVETDDEVTVDKLKQRLLDVFVRHGTESY